MSGHNILKQFAEGVWSLPDPGTGNAIQRDTPGIVNVITGASGETNTLADPVKAGVVLGFTLKTNGGGARVITTASAYDGAGGRTTITLATAGDFVLLISRVHGTGYRWDVFIENLASGATRTELNRLDDTNAVLATAAAAGFTGGTGTIYKTSVIKTGDLITTRIYFDLTGLGSSTTDLDIIGQGAAAAAYIGQITAARNGTIDALSLQCLEAPATGVTDIDLYSATEATGKFDDLVTGLTETALITSGGAWTNGATKGGTAVPAASEYLYVCNGAAGTVGTYTAGKFLLTLYGY